MESTPKRRAEPLERPGKKARPVAEVEEEEESESESEGVGYAAGAVVKAADITHALARDDGEASSSEAGIGHEESEGPDAGAERREAVESDPSGEGVERGTDPPADSSRPTGDFAWIGELVTGGHTNFVGKCSNIRTWRILPNKAFKIE